MNPHIKRETFLKGLWEGYIAEQKSNPDLPYTNKKWVDEKIRAGRAYNLHLWLTSRKKRKQITEALERLTILFKK